MGQNRHFHVEKIALFSHGGAIHDTIASVERWNLDDEPIATDNALILDEE